MSWDDQSIHRPETQRQGIRQSETAVKALPPQLPVTELWTFHPGDLCDSGSSWRPTLGQIWTQTHTNLVKLGIFTKLHNSQLSDVTTGEVFLSKGWKTRRRNWNIYQVLGVKQQRRHLFTEIKGTGDDKVKWDTFCILCHCTKMNVYLFQTLIGVFA